jgi:glucosylceramidase
VHVQNEPYACQNFPSCLWNGEQLSDFIKNYLGPELENLNVEIWLGTINNRNYNDYAGLVLSDPQTKKYITGVGYQWSGKHAIGQTAIEHPDMKLMQTESECGGNENNMSSAVKTFGLIDHYLKAGANSYMYWNMVLDNSGLSTWGWPQNSMISIDRATREPKYNMEFYVMKHFSHFVKKDAHRLATTGCDENTLAFQNPDNEIIIVVMNDSHNDMKYTIEVEGKMFELMVPSGSFNTFQIN